MKNLSIICLVFSCLLISCHERDKPSLTMLDKLPADSILEIQTYDSSNQVVHPDIVLRDNQLILAITPYPFYNDKKENPCLYRSSDGLKFSTFLPGLNPIVQAPPYDHNCDPDIFYDAYEHLHLFYLECMRPDSQNIVDLEFDPQFNFLGRKTVVHYDLPTDPFVVSPSVVRKKNTGEFSMLYVDITDPNDQRIRRISTDDPKKWDKNAVLEVDNKLPPNYQPWHLDVIGYAQYYFLITNGYYSEQGQKKYTINLSVSKDLQNWKQVGDILTPENVPDKHLNYLYRSTGIFYKNHLYIWYSYVTKNDVWKMAFKKIYIGNPKKFF